MTQNSTVISGTLAARGAWDRPDDTRPRRRAADIAARDQPGSVVPLPRRLEPLTLGAATAG